MKRPKWVHGIIKHLVYIKIWTPKNIKSLLDGDTICFPTELSYGNLYNVELSLNIKRKKIR